MAAPTILLADDEAHIACVVSQKLRNSGFSVVVARDGEEAFELACRIRPLLVVTDLQMPRMSGLELAQKMRRTPELSEVPLLMLTARGYVLEETELQKTNIRQLIAKPFSAQTVVRRVVELIGEAGSQTAEAA